MDVIDDTTIERNGVTFRVTLVPDYDSSPAEFGCYGTMQTRAWREGRWRFVGVIVALDDLERVDGTEASLWGVEHGDLPGHAGSGEEPIEITLASIVECYADDLVSECVILTRRLAQRLTAAVVSFPDGA